MPEVNWTALVIFVLLFAFITWLGFAAANGVKVISTCCTNGVSGGAASAP